VRETFSYDMSFSNVDIFYPFGPEFGDNLVPKVDDSFVGPIDIATTFPFFDRSFTSLFVNTNGLVSFDTGVTTYVPIAFPLPNIISVAPFWADVDIRRGGDIFYREITDFSILNLLSYEYKNLLLILQIFVLRGHSSLLGITWQLTEVMVRQLIIHFN
jgi:hypothetical protein